MSIITIGNFAKPLPYDQQFRHQDLDLSRDSTQIRLVRICPGLDSDPIQCTLEHASFYKQYHCLSYEWGPAEGQQSAIVLNGAQFQVRPNLWKFLHTARRYGYNEPIWIDAICIKQDDTAEKNHQVRLMGRIFLRAVAIIVWLGLTDGQISTVSKLQIGPEPDEDLLDLVLTWNREQVALCQGNTLAEESVTSWARRYCHQAHNDLRLSIFKVLDEIASSSYWSRAWIVQEIIVAQRLCLLGPSTYIDLSALFAEKHMQLVPGMTRIRERTRLLSRCSRSDMPKTDISRWALSKGSPLSLSQLLGLTRDRECCNVQDKVYSIMYLWKYGYMLKVDYKMSPIDILLNVMQITADVERSWDPIDIGMAAGLLTENLQIRPDTRTSFTVVDALHNRHLIGDKKVFWTKSRSIMRPTIWGIIYDKYMRSKWNRTDADFVRDSEKNYRDRMAQLYWVRPAVEALCIFLKHNGTNMLVEIPMIWLPTKGCYTNSLYLSESFEYGSFHECWTGQWNRRISAEEAKLAREVDPEEGKCNCSFWNYSRDYLA